jgi:hypothetical protein
VFENSVLRRIFGAKKDEVTGEWRKLHNEELNDLYSSPTIVWVIKLRRKMGGACSMYWGGKRCVQGFGGKIEGKRPRGRPRHRCENNIKADLQEVGCGVWTGLGWLWIETGGGHL